MPIASNPGVNTPNANYQSAPVDQTATAAEIQDAAVKVLKHASASLTQIDNVGAKILNKVINFALPTLAAPAKGAIGAAAIALQIGALQDMLSQLTAASSKLQIDQRMKESFATGQAELDKFKESLAAQQAEEAQKAEGAKKGNVIDAISNWVQAAVSVISIAFTVVAALAQAAVGNMVAAAALIVSATALGVQLGGQLVLAIDSTMKATGGAGFLSPSQRADCEKVIEIAGYVSMAAGAIGMIGGMAGALGTAAKEAVAKGGAEAGKSGMRLLAEQGVAAAKEAVKSVVDDALTAIRAFMDKPLAVMGNAMKSLANSLDEAMTAADDAMRSAWNTTKAAPGKLLQSAKDLPGNLAKGLKELPDDIARAARSNFTLQGHVDRLSNMGAGLTELPLQGLSARTNVLLDGTMQTVNAAAMSALANKTGEAVIQSSGDAIQANLDIKSADLRLTTEQAQAAQKKLAAAIEQLTALIGQLQDALKETFEKMQEVMQLIFGCVKEAAEAMTVLIAAQHA